MPSRHFPQKSPSQNYKNKNSRRAFLCKKFSSTFISLFLGTTTKIEVIRIAHYLIFFVFNLQKNILPISSSGQKMSSHHHRRRPSTQTIASTATAPARLLSSPSTSNTSTGATPSPRTPNSAVQTPTTSTTNNLNYYQALVSPIHQRFIGNNRQNQKRNGPNLSLGSTWRLLE
jgi:hypothetical protein